MSEWELLYLILVVIYCWECAWWVPRGSVAFLTRHNRLWRIVHPGVLLGNMRGGFIFAHPLPPLGTLLTGSQLPLSLSADAVLAFVAPSVNPSWRPEQTGRLVRFDEIRKVEARGKKVRVNGELLIKTASSGYAEYLAAQLRRLGKQSPAERPAAIKELVEHAFDTSKLKTRWEDFVQRSSAVRRLTNVLFVYLFVLVPVLFRFVAFDLLWVVLLVGLLALMTATALKFRLLHKSFYPAAEDERFTHFFTVLLAPATTLRACDMLSKPLLQEYHPLAIARVLCAEPQFRELARQVVREIRHPGLPVCPSAEPLARGTEAQGRAALLSAVEKFLKQSGIELESLCQAPVAVDAMSLSYCPRCLAQFTTKAGLCSDCGGRELVSFAEPTATGSKSAVG